MLSDSKIRGLKPQEKRYSVADGEGLIISVFPTGKKNGYFRTVSLVNKAKKHLVNILKLAVVMHETWHVILKIRFQVKKSIFRH